MKKEEFINQLGAQVPGLPEAFERAMQTQMNRLAAQERNPRPRGILRGFPRRAALIAMITVLLAGTAALASALLKVNVLEAILWGSPKNAKSVIQYDLAKQSFGECDVEVRQAAYDGVSLYIVYSIRERGAAGLLGEYDDETGLYYFGGHTFPAMERDGIGWWTDQFWIDGRNVNMPSMSTGMIVGSDTPGELLFYEMYRLDQEGIVLNGRNVEIALPIGKRQPAGTLVAGSDGATAKPAQGLITFHLDCSVRNGVTVTHPNVAADLETHQAAVTEATYSPVQLYVTMGLQVKQEALDAYIAANGAGRYGDDGRLLQPYGGMDVFGDWVAGLQLVDGNGVPVFAAADLAGVYGLGGYDNEHAWFTFPYLETYPAEMYLAPTNGDTADMAQAVRLQ